jgi:hypothetical protein
MVFMLAVVVVAIDVMRSALHSSRFGSQMGVAIATAENPVR